MPARLGPRDHIPTHAILEAIATRGPRWTAAFPDAEITSINEALDRELLNGNLTDAQTLSDQGERALTEYLGHPNDQGKIDLRIDHACRDHSPCWTIRCVRCETTQFDHVTEDVLEERVQKVIAGHLCTGSPDRTR